MSNKLTHEDYENKLMERELPWVPLEKYINGKIAIKHECINGHVHSITPGNVLTGIGCAHCSGMAKRNTATYKEALLEKNIFYTPIEEYKNTKTSIKHKCLEGHIWLAPPQNILKGKGCPECATSGFNVNKPANLYYVKITKDNEVYYKIGVTNRTALKRLSLDLKDKNIEILFEKRYETGKEALKIEQEILRNNPRVTVPGFLKSSGNTELFEIDVMENINVSCL